jgi:VIT1/CCC1 family predicted Fe2+/Mn2+ transporter
VACSAVNRDADGGSSKGLPPDLSRYVADHLTARDPLRAHAEAELGIDPEQPARPGHATLASFLSFMAGAVLPLLAITLVPVPARIPVTVVAVLAALMATGTAGAALSRVPRGPAVLRNVIGGAIAMGVTYAVGMIVGTAVG